MHQNSTYILRNPPSPFPNFFLKRIGQAPGCLIQWSSHGLHVSISVLWFIVSSFDLQQGLDKSTHLLPYENATEAHRIYSNVHLEQEIYSYKQLEAPS